MGMHIGTPVSGGTHTTYSKYGVKTFTSSGTFTTKVPLKCDILVVAGGAGGGGRAGGGGGAGGFVYYSAKTLAAGDYTVVVGAGGSGGLGSRVFLCTCMVINRILGFGWFRV